MPAAVVAEQSVQRGTRIIAAPYLPAADEGPLPLPPASGGQVMERAVGTCVFVCVCVCARLSVCVCVCLSVCLSVGLSVCLSVCVW
jgi:hypothetical protein